MIADDMNTKDNDIIIHPVKTKKDSSIPPLGVLFVNPGEAKYAINKTLSDGGRKCFLHNSLLAISPDDNRFITGPAIGAPAAVLALEKLIALGAKKIVFMGWCGAIEPELKIGDIIVPSSALIGEGTSKYYTEDKHSYPSSVVIEGLSTFCDKLKLSYYSGAIWSTDAPYRESRKFLAQIYKEKKIIGVDMEFSALCSVAAFRCIDFAAIMVVSDELWGDSWQPGFRKPVFKENCKEIVNNLMQIAL